MGQDTKIEWAHHTFNPWTGCTKISPACDHCYAESWSKRAGDRVGKWGPGASRVRTTDDNWKNPGRWNAEAERLGVRYQVFCASLADVFDNEVPPEWREDLFTLIEQTPHLDWLLLTKRIGNVGNMLPVPFDFDRLYPNVWIGASITSQAEADRDIPKLLAVPAAKRFLSMEPLLGPVDLRNIPHGEGEIDALKPDTWELAIEQWRDTDDEWVEQFEDWFGVTLNDGLTGPMHAGIDWVIVGGESGPNARPMHPDWSRSLRDQCQAAGVPFLFKQWGEWCPRGPESLGYPSVDGVPRLRMTDAGHNGQDLASDGGNDVWMNRAGKKAAGRLLDGREWNEVP